MVVGTVLPAPTVIVGGLVVPAQERHRVTGHEDGNAVVVVTPLAGADDTPELNHLALEQLAPQAGIRDLGGGELGFLGVEVVVLLFAHVHRAAFAGEHVGLTLGECLDVLYLDEERRFRDVREMGVELPFAEVLEDRYLACARNRLKSTRLVAAAVVVGGVDLGHGLRQHTGLIVGEEIGFPLGLQRQLVQGVLFVRPGETLVPLDLLGVLEHLDGELAHAFYSVIDQEIGHRPVGEGQ